MLDRRRHFVPAEVSYFNAAVQGAHFARRLSRGWRGAALCRTVTDDGSLRGGRNLSFQSDLIKARRLFANGKIKKYEFFINPLDKGAKRYII